MKVKVCGMTTMEQLYQLQEIGVDYAGFIFYPQSPRFVTRNGMNGTDVRNAGLKLKKVGVFVDATYNEIMKQVEAFGLDMVQLHGKETPFESSRIAENIPVIKAFRFMEHDHVEWTIKDYYSAADMFLFDTGVSLPTNEHGQSIMYGGTGRKFNWNLLKELSIRKPFFLSGGIEPGDSQLVLDFLKETVAKDLFAVDINSRFERSPGIKDIQKVEKFITEIKA